jgi:hypothetical protein
MSEGTRGTRTGVARSATCWIGPARSWPPLRSPLGAPGGIGAAHMRRFNFEGSDDLDNGSPLCSPHHKLLRRGAIGLRDPGTVIVSLAFSAIGKSGRSESTNCTEGICVRVVERSFRPWNTSCGEAGRSSSETHSRIDSWRGV